MVSGCWVTLCNALNHGTSCDWVGSFLRAVLKEFPWQQGCRGGGGGGGGSIHFPWYKEWAHGYGGLTGVDVQLSQKHLCIIISSYMLEIH